MARKDDFMFYASVDDELYNELQALAGQKLVFSAVWEDSLADGLLSGVAEGKPAPSADGSESFTCDIDLYLEDGVYFELYSVAVFRSLDGDPLADQDEVENALYDLLRGNASLGDVAVDDEDALVLVLNSGPKPALYLAVGGWVLEEWDELPV
jgi:hypothetical protein